MSDLLELAERCEQATGPDRELDGSIWWATRSPDDIADLDPTGFLRECIERDGSAGKALAQFYDSSKPHCLAKLAFLKAYTASLDAAMTLVPEGFVMAVTNCGTDSPHGPDFTKASAVAGRDEDKGIEPVTAATPALALCAAALRARAAQ